MLALGPGLLGERSDPGAHFCSFTTESGLRPDATPVLAVAESEWDTIRSDEHRYLSSWLRMLSPWSFVRDGDTIPSTPQAKVDSIAAIPTPAQRFRVLEVLLRDGPAIETGALVFVVPWGHTPGCDYRLALISEWVPAGDTVVFQLQRTRGGEDLVFDVHYYRNPYPASPEEVMWWGRNHPEDDSPRWITPKDYFHVLGHFSIPSRDMSRDQFDRLGEQLRPWSEARGISDLQPINRWLKPHGGPFDPFLRPTQHEP